MKRLISSFLGTVLFLALVLSFIPSVAALAVSDEYSGEIYYSFFTKNQDSSYTELMECSAGELNEDTVTLSALRDKLILYFEHESTVNDDSATGWSFIFLILAIFGFIFCPIILVVNYWYVILAILAVAIIIYVTVLIIRGIKRRGKNK